MRIIEWKKKKKQMKNTGKDKPKKKKKKNWNKMGVTQIKIKNKKKKAKQMGFSEWVFLVNLVVCGTTNNIPSFPLSFHFFSFLVHLLLGNCRVHTTSLLQLYSPVATISHWTLFSSSTDCVFLSLFISSTLTTWTISSRSSLLSYSILCVNSLFFVYLFIKFWFVFNFCLIDGKTVENEEKGQIYFWVFFCVFLFYFWIFPLVAVVIIK